MARFNTKSKNPRKTTNHEGAEAYTMTPEMVFDAVRIFKPKVLYPYHFGNTDVNILLELFKETKDCEIRIRKLN